MIRSHYCKYTAFAAVVIMGLAGCDLAQNHLQIDRAGNKSVQDYRDALAPRPQTSDDKDKTDDKTSSANIPDFEPYIARNGENLKPMPIVSVSINESVPVRDVLYELAKQSGYGIELDPRISGSIIFTAKNKPLDVVIERIADMVGLRYKIRDNSIKVRLDTPYTKSYKIDYLNIIRENEGSVSTDVSLVSTADGGGSDGTESGSSFSIESEGVSDFWNELQGNITTILRSHARPDLMRTGSASGAGDQDSDLSSIGSNSNGSGSGGGSGPARLSVDSLEEASGDGQSGANSAAARYLPQFTINKQAGLVTVHASSGAHKQLQSYFNQLRRAVSAQVLIQAKVMQVELKDEFSAGIEWEAVNPLAGEGSLSFQNPEPGQRLALPGGTAGESFVAGIDGQDFSALAEALSRFGTVNTLASPRITAVNNQSALLSVAKNDVYFRLDIETEEDEETGDETITVDSEIQSVPEGVLINVMPSIDLDDREVSMRIRPTITEIVDRVNDPAVPLTLSQLGDGDIDEDTLRQARSQVPVVDLQEIDTLVNMESNEAIVIGGLMQDSTNSEQVGVPVLSEVPGIGPLFRKQADEINKKELVIFLKTTILDKASDSVHQTDKELYREFSQDRRPLDL